MCADVHACVGRILLVGIMCVQRIGMSTTFRGRKQERERGDSNREGGRERERGRRQTDIERSTRRNEESL